MNISYLISILLIFFNSLCFANNIENNNHKIEHKEPLDQNINVEYVEINDDKEIYIYIPLNKMVIFGVNSLTGRERVKQIPKNDTEYINVHLTFSSQNSLESFQENVLTKLKEKFPSAIFNNVKVGLINPP